MLKGGSLVVQGADFVRVEAQLAGAVQGVGFRPFLYNLAKCHGISGWAKNTSAGIELELLGTRNSVDAFIEKVSSTPPVRAKLHTISCRKFSHPGGEGLQSFAILESQANESVTTCLPTDIASCKDCLSELSDPQNRRYRYPFISCVNCGPRFSIISKLPYDRKNTSMASFAMCDKCKTEYANPNDRRFHAQTNCCEQCGPNLSLWDSKGERLSSKHDALLLAADLIRQGKILALKGLGGFQLIVDANNANSIATLRERKYRPAKPFAVMYPSADGVLEDCLLSDTEVQLLNSAEAPIVLLEKRRDFSLAENISSNNPYLGVMLPYTPLHYLLLNELDFAIVASSGNISNEPIVTIEQEALTRLRGIADYFLTHDRPILSATDDSLVQVIDGHAQILRAARGYAPMVFELKASAVDAEKFPKSLAVGAQLKNCVAISSGKQAVVSQYLGDLADRKTTEVFEKTIEQLESVYKCSPQVIIRDLHPDYSSSRYATSRSNQDVEIVSLPVQHHYAHALACLAENPIDLPALAVTWDGTGYGSDGNLWGGEFLEITEKSFKRRASFYPFQLAGGEKAIEQPKRIALSLLYELQLKKQGTRKDRCLEEISSTHRPLFKHFSKTELQVLSQMLSQEINSVSTSSIGRLFDGVSALLGLCAEISYEGEAAMKLQFASDAEVNDSYHMPLLETDGDEFITIDWRPMLQTICDEIQSESSATIAAKFHHTLSNTLVEIANTVGLEDILLCGGCFQNKYLLELSISALRQAGFRPHWQRRLPPNDSCISLGQIVAARRECQSIQNVTLS